MFIYVLNIVDTKQPGLQSLRFLCWINSCGVCRTGSRCGWSKRPHRSWMRVGAKQTFTHLTTSPHARPKHSFPQRPMNTRSCTIRTLDSDRIHEAYFLLHGFLVLQFYYYYCSNFISSSLRTPYLITQSVSQQISPIQQHCHTFSNSIFHTKYISILIKLLREE